MCEADVTQSIQDWIEDKVQPCNCGDVILQAYRLKIDKKVDTSEILVDHKDALSKDEQEAKSTSTFEDIDRMVGFAMNKVGGLFSSLCSQYERLSTQRYLFTFHIYIPKIYSSYYKNTTTTTTIR